MLKVGLIAKKAVELGFADSIMFSEKNEDVPDNEGIIFSKMTVTNSLLSKLPIKQEKPKDLDINTLDKRLDLLKF